MARDTPERILNGSLELFNQAGTVAVTTNHIAKYLKMSPGNLYFHFASKEEIIRELFARHCMTTYACMDYKLRLSPREFVERSFDTFWHYRFFYREMYHLRRSDPKLSQAWRAHMKRSFRLLKLNYRNWVRAGTVRRIRDSWQLEALSESVLLSASAVLCFFESASRPGTRRTQTVGLDRIHRLLVPHYTDQYKKRI